MYFTHDRMDSTHGPVMQFELFRGTEAKLIGRVDVRAGMIWQRVDDLRPSEIDTYCNLLRAAAQEAQRQQEAA
jgi:hypothetical protein